MYGVGMNEYIKIIVWSLGIGICLCNFYIYYNKTILGNFVRKFIEKEIFGEESAISAENLGLSQERFEKALKSSVALRGVVERLEQQHVYYIPEDKKAKAIKMFGTKGTSIIHVIIMSFIILAFSYLAGIALPWIISVIQGLF